MIQVDLIDMNLFHMTTATCRRKQMNVRLVVQLLSLNKTRFIHANQFVNEDINVDLPILGNGYFVSSHGDVRYIIIFTS